jgi:hypothetical protein
MKTAVELLATLTSPEYLGPLGVVTSAPALLRLLNKEPLVRELRKCLASGELSEDGIRRYVSKLSRDFQPGVQFPHEFALAALAVVLESWNSAFAEEYLRDLAKLRRVSEFELAPSVAERCRAMRSQNLPTTRRSIHRLRGADKKWDVKRTNLRSRPLNLAVNIRTIALSGI